MLSRLVTSRRFWVLTVLITLAVVLLAGAAAYIRFYGTDRASPEQGRERAASLPDLNCSHTPLGGFYDVWSNPQVWPHLGCAVAPAEPVTGTEAYPACMHSLWLREKRLFVIVEDSGRRWLFVPDESGLPEDTPLMVGPASRPQPYFPATGRHGWLVRSSAWGARCGDGARGNETVFSGALQQFEGGWLLWNSDVCFVLFADGTWTMF